jgi:hypothetical protein
MLPSTVTLLLLGATLILTGSAGLLLAQRRAAGDLKAVRFSMRRVAAALLESARAESQLDTLRQVQRGAEQTVHLGAETVRAVHLGIARIPFGILEAIPATRPVSRLVRGVHDGISNVVYDTITGANRAIGSTLRQGLPRQPPDDEGKPSGDQGET